MWPPALPVALTHPLYLCLLVALPAFCALARRARRRRRVPRGPWPLGLWLRLAVALLLILALAGLQLPAPPRRVATVFVLDLSDSVPADIREAAKSWVRQAMGARGPDDLVGIVTFGREAHVKLPLGREPPGRRDHAQWGEATGGAAAGSGTNIAAALELAADLLPSPQAGVLRRIVLLSDGNETLGDAYHALLRPHLRDVEGQGHHQLAAPGFVELAFVHPLLEQVQLRLAHRALEPQQQSVVVLPGIVEAVGVGQQRAEQRAQFQQPVPVGVRAGNPLGVGATSRRPG